MWSLQAFHHDVTVPRICPGSDQIFAKYQGLDPGHDLLVTPRSHSRILRMYWLNIHGNTTNIRSGDPWYPGYRNIFPHHVNSTIPHLISVNENHLKSREVAVYTFSGSFNIIYIIRIYIPLTFSWGVLVRSQENIQTKKFNWGHLYFH